MAEIVPPDAPPPPRAARTAPTAGVVPPDAGVPAGASVALPGPTVVSLMDMERLIEKMMGLVRAGGGPGSGELALASSALNKLSEEIGRTVRRSNSTHPGISAFSHPEGDELHPKDPLRYDTYVCHTKMHETQLRPIEIDLFNRFEGDKEAHDGTWMAVLDKHGKKKRLMITFPARTIDHLAQAPPLVQVLSELLYGSDVADPAKAMERLQTAERQIAELRDQLAKFAVAV